MYSLKPDEMAQMRQWLGSGSINIFGLPFSGKDTHGHILAKLLHAHLIAGGEILRSSALPPRAQALVDSGRLAPSDLYCERILHHLASAEHDGAPLILSSVGRWIGEETLTMQAAERSGHPLRAVVYLHIDKHVAYERFLHSQQIEDRGYRADDRGQNLERRFSEFQEKTIPVIEFYRSRSLLIEVDGNPPIPEVGKTILTTLLEYANRARLRQS